VASNFGSVFVAIRHENPVVGRPIDPKGEKLFSVLGDDLNEFLGSAGKRHIGNQIAVERGCCRAALPRAFVTSGHLVFVGAAILCRTVGAPVNAASGKLRAHATRALSLSPCNALLEYFRAALR
jgi:hypothetical protein